jgi:hypothetical protein
MANIKTYQIVINGIEQSISAVDALNKQLDALEKKIDALQGKAVNAASSSSGGGSRTAELSDEDKLLKQIEATQARINQADMADYKVLLDKKQELKELVTEQKSMTAEARLTEGAYANTMQGMKQHLADIKAAMQTVDLGDTDTFKKLTKDANELNQKLLEIEKSYGQFGRNVGNYPSAAEGFKGLKIQVGDTVAEFVNARQALKALKQEMQTLSTKNDMGIISEEEAERLKSLIPTVKQLESSIQDAGKPMDALMDNMQSFVALAQAGQGLAAFFGLEGTEIDETIKNLVALQNAMQGLQTIQNQLQTGEGLGKYFAKANTAIDEFTKKLFGVKKATTEVTTASKAQAAATSTVATASKGAATAEVAQTTATAGLTVGMKAATVAARLLSTALKAIGIGILLEGVSLAIEGIKSLVSWITSESEEEKKAAKAAKEHADMVKAGAEAYANAAAKVNQYKMRIDAFNGSAKQEKKLVNELNNEFGDQIGKYKSLEEWKKALVELAPTYLETLKNEAILTQLAAKWAEIYAKKLQMLEMFKSMPNWAKEGIENYFEEQLSGVSLSMNEIIEKNQSLYETLGDLGDDYTEEIKGRNNKILEAERELNNLRIQNMKEGLNKTLTQLEEERKQKLAKVRADGIMVGEMELQINQLYDRKIEDAKKRHAEKVEETYRQMWNSIFKINLENNRKTLEILRTSAELYANTLENAKITLFNQGISSYGIQGKNQLTPDTRDILGIVSANANDETIKDFKRLFDLMRDYLTANNALKTAIISSNSKIDDAEANLIKVEEETNKKLEELEKEKDFMFEDEYEAKKYEIQKVLDQETLKVQQLKEHYDAQINLLQTTNDAKLRLYEEFNAQLKEKYHTQEQQELAKIVFNKLLEENYSKDLSTMFNQRLTAVQAYWTTRIANEKIDAEALYEQSVALENAEYEARRREAKDAADALEEQAIKANDANLMDEEKTKEAIERIWTEFWNKMVILEKEHTQKLRELENQKADSLKAVNTEYYQDALQEFRDFQTALSNLESKQPVMNAWGITNLKQTNKNNKELLDSYENLAQQITLKRKEITDSYQNGLIDENIYKSSIRELDSFTADLGTKIDDVKEKLSFSGQWEALADGINTWVQAIGNAANNILSSISEMTSNQYDEQIEQQQKYIDEYSDLLDKQKEKTQEYADAVSQIENELSNARGDRRQQLIDNLNAEMAAQRASLAQEKKIEKEREKAEEKRKELEQDKAEAEKRMQIWQAGINAAMAVSMAAVNHWPVPAIPMMALAAAVGAAQIAAVASKPIPKYGDGGVIQGASHAQGGIKVLGGRAEIEGGEFITNKVTTAKNVGLLEYINTKRRKVDIADLLEFYNSGRPSKSIASVRTRFADGGVIPQLRTDINFNDRLITAFEDYSNRPQYVQVVDIIDQTERLNEVKVISGLEV